MRMFSGKIIILLTIIGLAAQSLSAHDFWEPLRAKKENFYKYTSMDSDSIKKIVDTIFKKIKDSGIPILNDNGINPEILVNISNKNLFASEKEALNENILDNDILNEALEAKGMDRNARMNFVSAVIKQLQQAIEE